jgi:TusA-related sulfurtransferase
MASGERLRVIADDPRAEREIPVAAECEGWAVLEVVRHGSELFIVIER